jgi:hypothetical protein
LDPVQLHVNGPVPDTAVAVPEEQRFVVGAEATEVPFAEPHVPLIGVGVGGGVVPVFPRYEPMRSPPRIDFAVAECPTLLNDVVASLPHILIILVRPPGWSEI